MSRPAGPSELGRARERYLVHLLVERGLAGPTLDAYARDLHTYLETLAAQGIAHAARVERRPGVCRNRNRSRGCLRFSSNPAAHRLSLCSQEMVR